MYPRECHTAKELGTALPLECHAFWEVKVKIDSHISEIDDCVGKIAQIREAGKCSHANCVIGGKMVGKLPWCIFWSLLIRNWGGILG